MMIEHRMDERAWFHQHVFSQKQGEGLVRD